MSAQINGGVIIAPRKIRSTPAARQINNSFSEGFSPEWTFVAPIIPGTSQAYKLDELIVDFVITTTGAATSGRPADLIKTLKVFAEDQVLEIDGASIGVAALASHYFEAEDGFSTQPGNAEIVQNTAFAAAGGYYGSFRIKAPLPGSALKVVLNTVDADSITDATNLTYSVSVTAIWSRDSRPQYTLFCRQATQATKRAYNNVIRGMFVSDSDFNTVGDGISLEGDLTPEQVLARQAQVADESRGLSADGSGTARANGPLLVTDPNGVLGTTVGIFQLAMRSVLPKQATIGLNAASTLIAFVMSQLPTTKVLEQ